jgi:site-specific DNA recombinase
MKAFIYLRVSTPGQARNGVSISRDDEEGFQEARCRALCAFKGWEMSEPPFSDLGITGRRKGAKKRDGLASACDATCEAKGVLVVYAIARLGRSAGYIHNMADRLEDAGANIASACEPIDTSTAMGRAFFGVTAVFAQLESDQISERTRASHKILKDRHGVNVIGPPPYGYQRAKGSRVVEPEPDEQKTIRKAKLLRKPLYEGAQPTSYKQVARQLNELGFRTRLEGEWTEGSVWRILNPAGRVCPTRESCAS